jgi:response regulator RpfG family c-di-GMP phosphodiesterase
VNRLRTFLIAAVLAVLSAGAVHLTGALDTLEHDSVDARFSLRAADRPDELVVVAVDDVTFSDLGLQWPFSRTVFARAVDRLRRAEAREIVFDIQFTEQTKVEEDWALYEAIDRAGGAVLATSETDGKGGHNILGGEANLRAIGATGAASNLPDEDSGVVRRLDSDIDGLPTIAGVVARRAGRPVDPARFAGGPAWIDFRGGPGTIRTVSFSELVKGRIDPAVLRDKIVVLGASAPTLQDVHPTSTARRELMSGPEIQANAIWTALHGMPLRSAPSWAALLAILALALVVPLAALRLGPVLTIATGLVAGVAYAVCAQLLFAAGTVVVVVAPLLGLLVSMIVTTVVGELLEGRERRRVAYLNTVLEEAVRERTADLDALQLEIIERLGQAVDSRDEETGEHINRITALSHALATAIGMDPQRAEMLRRASAMHDVGKVAIPDAILQHPGPLSPEQRRVMETHTTIGARILSGSRSPLVQMGELIALTHHEKWNGQGYPHGLAGEEIPLEGRVVAVCDVFDALVSRRPYKEPWAVEDALAEIERSAGTHFDPDLAEAFVRVVRADVRAAQPVLTG